MYKEARYFVLSGNKGGGGSAGGAGGAGGVVIGPVGGPGYRTSRIKNLRI